MRVQSEKTRATILKVLNEADRPMGAGQIVSALLSAGVDLSPRTVRFYLLQLDERGYTDLISRRRGRRITERGREELARTNVIDKVGIISARIDMLGYRMTFRSSDGKGKVIMNACLVGAGDFTQSLNELQPAFLRGITMAPRLFMAREGETVGNLAVPKGQTLIGTVCSMTLNGILLHEGIPVISRFGGLLEMRDWNAVRFVELIEYRGSTLDPFEVFVKADMTRVRSAARTGSGMICASFREIPSAAAADVRRIEKRLKAYGLGGILAIGRPSQPLFGVPVSDGYCGMVVVGGLNPIAAIHEAGIKVSIRSLAELQDYGDFLDIKTCLPRAPHPRD
jgi:HTH-type transcriptional regulator, global nitrogen regulator NrpRI